MVISAKRILITSGDFLPGLPAGLLREEAPGYILSKTYARILGDHVPRREILLKLAATMAFAAIPLRAAKGVPLLVPVAISAVACGAAAFRLFQKTFGTFTAENEEEKQLRGYCSITVYDQNSNTVEGSMTARYSFPANTSVEIKFLEGPAATTKGDKLLEVAAQDSNDEDEFECA